MSKLIGKVALVTGAARGIGRACALELAASGADVVINDFGRADTAAETARAVESLGRRSFAVDCDVSDRERVEAMIAETVVRFGRIDILINNAGKGYRQPFLELEPTAVQRSLDVIFWGAFHSGQFAARRMVEQGGGGSIVMISSVHAHRPYARAAGYNAAKAAVNHLTATMAVELASHRIRVNWIEPGWIDTPGEHETFGDSTLAEQGAALPWGRLGRPEEIAKGALFLASDDSSYMTGQCLRIDGGFTLPIGGR